MGWKWTSSWRGRWRMIGGGGEFRRHLRAPPNCHQRWGPPGMLLARGYASTWTVWRRALIYGGETGITALRGPGDSVRRGPSGVGVTAVLVGSPPTAARTAAVWFAGVGVRATLRPTPRWTSRTVGVFLTLRSFASISAKCREQTPASVHSRKSQLPSTASSIRSREASPSPASSAYGRDRRKPDNSCRQSSCQGARDANSRGSAKVDLVECGRCASAIWGRPSS